MYQLNELANNNEIPITVRITKTEIHLIYDEQRVNNYHFNKTEYFKELKTIDKTDDIERKNLYKK